MLVSSFRFHLKVEQKICNERFESVTTFANAFTFIICVVRDIFGGFTLLETIRQERR